VLDKGEWPGCGAVKGRRWRWQPYPPGIRRTLAWHVRRFRVRIEQSHVCMRLYLAMPDWWRCVCEGHVWRIAAHGMEKTCVRCERHRWVFGRTTSCQ
jgi:hypothetical protein